MSRNMNYTRKFIILKRDYCGIAGHNPKGHGKLEIRGIKGSLSLNVEDAEVENFYNVVFIGKNTSETIGRVYTDENGKGKAELSLNLPDLESKGFPIEKINGILIIRDWSVLLGGYIDKEDKSIERFIEDLNQVEIPAIIEEIEIPSVEIEEVEEPSLEWREVEAIMPELELEHEPQIIEEPVIEEAVEDLLIYHKEAIEPTYEPLNEIIDELELAQEEALEEDLEIPYELVLIEDLQLPAEETVIEDLELPTEEAIIEDLELPTEEAIIEDLELPTEEAIIEDLELPTEEAIIEDLELPIEEVIIGVYEIQEEIEAIEAPETPQEFEPAEEPEIEHNDFFSQEAARRVNQRNQTTNYILNILRFFPYIDPFSVKLEGYNWWKIDFQEEIDTRGFLPYFSYIAGGSQKVKRTEDYVTALDLLRKYEHYIFGLYNVNDDVKFYVYGIPGSFIKSEHPHNGTTGFNTWFEGLQLDGYWLLYIDPLSGKVIFPANPMEPTN